MVCLEHVEFWDWGLCPLWCGYFSTFLIVWRHEYSLIFVCMHRQRNIYQSRTLDLLRNCLSDGQDGGCKQRGQTATIWLKVLLMPRLAVCSRDLHWHWINWTLLCDTMEVSMLRLAWLPIAQHVFQPALTGRLELISRKIVSSEQEQRLSRWADFAKTCLPRIECKELPRFREKYRALVRHVCKIREIGGQKNGVQHATAIYPIPRFTRLRYIGLTLYKTWTRCPVPSEWTKGLNGSGHETVAVLLPGIVINW